MLADRVLSVIRLQNTARGATEEHLHRFAASTPRHGVIINGVDAASANGGYGYGHNGYRSANEVPVSLNIAERFLKRAIGSLTR
jgi:hypothetical protein